MISKLVLHQTKNIGTKLPMYPLAWMVNVTSISFALVDGCFSTVWYLSMVYIECFMCQPILIWLFNSIT